jgi:hypothetical protein
MSLKPIAAAALVCAAVFVGAAGGPATSTAQAAASPHRCFTRDLRASLLPRSPAAGNRFAHLQLTNISKQTCTIFGFAGAQLLGGHGRHLPTNIVRDHSSRPHLITLRPGRRASAQWHWGAVPGRGEQGRKQCEPTAAKIEITPPDATTHRTIAWRLGPVCEHGRIVEHAFHGPY